jgi:ADP-ribose pyrophosphatase
MFSRVGSQTVFAGHHLSVEVGTFAYDDGARVKREIVHVKETVAIVAFDNKSVCLLSQPREPVTEFASLELPAGGVEPSEATLVAAQRELAEETGLRAKNWRHWHSFHTSPGCLDEVIHLYAATGLTQAEQNPDPEERLTVERFAVDELAGLFARITDAKTLVGLGELQRRQINGQLD